jgi:hypothetical protein
MKKNAILLLLLFACVVTSQAQLKVTSSNYVGLRTSTPSYYVDMNAPSFRTFYNSTQPFFVTHWGSDPRVCSTSKIVFYKSDDTGYIDIQCKTLYEYSDETAKENITSLSSDENSPSTETNIDKIKKLKGVKYTWKNDKGKKVHSGFLAQEVEKVIPEAVMTVDSTKSKSMAYNALIPYLVEAIKEQQVEIEELKKKLNQ